jgi:SAM-dependent methyltransferase
MSALPDRHLDLGCGDSPRNPYQRGELHGIDLRPMPSRPGVTLAHGNVVMRPIPYPDDHFGSVSAYDFLEHVPRILPTVDGESTWFPFIRLMNEIWRVLAPGGRLYALTPAFPSPAAFVDPTHVNILTDKSHEYFCGSPPIGVIYGFAGAFKPLQVDWVVYRDALRPHPLGLRESLSLWNRRRRGRLTHLRWELEAVKPST